MNSAEIKKINELPVGGKLNVSEVFPDGISGRLVEPNLSAHKDKFFTLMVSNFIESKNNGVELVKAFLLIPKTLKKGVPHPSLGSSVDKNIVIKGGVIASVQDGNYINRMFAVSDECTIEQQQQRFSGGQGGGARGGGYNKDSDSSIVSMNIIGSATRLVASRDGDAKVEDVVGVANALYETYWDLRKSFEGDIRKFWAEQKAARESSKVEDVSDDSGEGEDKDEIPF